MNFMNIVDLFGYNAVFIVFCVVSIVMVKRNPWLWLGISTGLRIIPLILNGMHFGISPVLVFG